MLSREDNELLCRTGPGTPMGNLFRRFWLPAMLASDLPGPDSEPWRLQILGERLVAFRDTNGQVGILDRHCPHRLADLWFGRNEDAGLTCAYHGWKFDTQGNTMAMPTEPADSDFKDRLKIKTYPAREFGGVIWVYMGPPELMPEELPQHKWARVPDDQRVVRSWIQESNYMQAVEGEIDSAHISFNHRWFKQEFQPPAQRVPVRTTADGIGPLAIFSIVARSPEYSPVPVIRTRSPSFSPARPVLADRLIDATVGRTYGSPSGGPPGPPGSPGRGGRVWLRGGG